MKEIFEEANKWKLEWNFNDYTVEMGQLANWNSEYLDVIKNFREYRSYTE